MFGAWEDTGSAYKDNVCVWNLFARTCAAIPATRSDNKTQHTGPRCLDMAKALASIPMPMNDFNSAIERLDGATRPWRRRIGNDGCLTRRGMCERKRVKLPECNQRMPP